MDIQQFLKNLSNYTRIDYHGKESEFEALSKYDVDHNSIFDTNELQAIKDDLIFHASTDGNSDDLSEEEAKGFLQSLLNNSQTLQDIVKSTVQTLDQYANNLLSQLQSAGKNTSIEDYLKENFPDREFSSEDISELSILTEEQFERAKTLFYVKNGKRQYEGYEIAKLAQLNEDDYEWFNEHLKDSPFKITQKMAIIEYRNKDIEQLLDKNLIKTISSLEGGITFLLNGDDNIKQYQKYDKEGLVESTTIETTEYLGFECNHKIVENKRLNIKQDAIISDEATLMGVLVENIFYYDSSGNVVKTITAKTNPETGVLNVSETDKNGTTKPIQWESIDPETGAKITERHLTSPEGVKTEFYAEERDDLKITEYKIVDKDGSELINIHQTFQQVSDNKFISSINITGNDEDTQIYEMEYTDDYKVKIFDKKNNKTTEIDLMQYFDNEDSAKKLLSTIKQLPGQVLLEFAEKPFLISYDQQKKANGNWSSYDNKLTIGTYENITREEGKILATFVHEFGHYLDLYNKYNKGEAYVSLGEFSENSDVINIFKEELESLQNSTTSVQQEYISYFIKNTGFDERRADKEKIAEAHALLYSNNDPVMETRRFYLAQYFPRTMAAIMKLLLEEEGVKTS